MEKEGTEEQKNKEIGVVFSSQDRAAENQLWVIL